MNRPEEITAEAVVVVPEADSRLEQLAAAYAEAKPAADAAKAHLDTITDAIKLELSMAAPGAHKVDLRAHGLVAPLRLSARTAWRLDTTLLKTNEPEVYVKYARQSSYWELRAVPANRGGAS